MKRSQIGWVLIAAAGLLAVAAVLLAMTGQAVGLGSQSIGGYLVIEFLILLGFGTAVLAITKSSAVLRNRVLRVSLGVLATGVLMEAAAAIGGASMVTDLMESWPLIILTLGGGLLTFVAVLALAIALPFALRSARVVPR